MIFYLYPDIFNLTMKKREKNIPVMEGTPWYKGNSFKCLKNGNNFFPAMLKSIKGAEKYVLMEMYIFESGHVATSFIDALCKAAKRGVFVYLLLDDFGSWNLNSKDRKRLAENGVFLIFYNPLRYGKWLANLRRNHRKLLLIDNLIAYTGGAGVTDDFSPLHQPSDFWLDTMVEISGPVVSDWQSSFQSIWNQWGEPFINLPIGNHSIEAADMEGRVALLLPPHRRDIIRSLLKRIRKSRKRIWIEMAYFIPSWKIRRALRKAARAGVDVRLLLPGKQTDHPSVRRISQRYYQSLLRNGVRIFEYAPRFLHSKVMLCDDWISIGSSNLDKWSLRWNLEANQEVIDSHFAEDMARMFLADLEESREIEYINWLKRPWYVRFIENFWEAIMIWTEYLIQLRTIRLLSSPRKGIRSLFRRSKKKSH
ncbi:MAG: phosphatidylserine/phosphatidylglycerophosphate/cardiolipin synthase family protein [Proteobacteria bacterium]|nr:phosphatidylserine/phosphatidylglycerophosphate/cardiolipin synthase family protein [Pseudomonadota bacterium]